MDKLDPKTDGASPDIVADNIDKLRELFPDAFTEGSDPDGPRWKVDFEALKQALGEYVEDERERYSFTWNGKARARQIAQSPSAGTLRPCPEESVNWDTTKNIFIEGDNLEVLKLLQKSYHKQVKMIYIDPPYNTGNEFIYPDRFQDNLDTYLRYTGQTDDEGFKTSTNSESSGRYHTNWLNMMYPRLRLARNLLRDDGVIFISIDNHENHNLRRMMDDIFGEENCISCMVWQSRTSISNDQEVSANHNYILIYAKNYDYVSFYGEALDASEYTNPDSDIRGPWKLIPIDANKPGGETYYPITNPTTGEQFYPPNGRSWAMNPKEYERLFEDDRIAFGYKGDSAPKKKLFLNERQAKGDTKTPSSILLDADTTKDGTNELMALFDGEKIFDYPKPSKLVRRFFDYSCDRSEENLVLDFFAGSCATAHASLKWELGSIRFIMIQLPEQVDPTANFFKAANQLDLKTIADIGKERIKRVINKGGQTGGNSGLKVYKLADSNIVPWLPDETNLKDDLYKSVNNIRSDRDEQDVLYELLLKYGLDLAVPIKRREIAGKAVHVIGAGALVVCLADQVDLGVVKGIATLKEELSPEIMRVVFKDNGFADDVVKTNTVQILRQAGVEDVKSL
ncbi:site-specific DNA-methyltransferase [Salinisphaera orenii]|uniref:site-specific DNA-methyltransferase n=1 Tax=Salinisphaera orenii TaxID=856731 RepID=UPI000DBE0E6E